MTAGNVQGVPAPTPPAGTAGRAGRPVGADWTVLAGVALGGMAGASARYGLAQAVHPGAQGFPWATLWTNISGSFALGLFLAYVLGRPAPPRWVVPTVGTGVVGGYTTYSTFAVESDRLLAHGHPALAAAYVAASLVGGAAAAWLGIWGGRIPARRPTPEEEHPL